jgi:exodeoxyribonuclease-3
MIKIMSWNVNGIRAAHRKGLLEILARLDADLICLQETKAQVEQLPEDLREIRGYSSYFYSAERKGYSGVATFSRPKPRLVREGIGVGDFDREGRVLTHEFDDYFLVNCYVPNAQPELARIDFRKEFNDKLKGHLVSLDKEKPVILCGDLNVAHRPIDLKNPKANERNPGYSIEEREKFDELLQAGFVDTFRHLYPEKVSYTWWSYRFNARQKDIGWRIDYFLISRQKVSAVTEVIHHQDIFGSDHCPISLRVDL